MEMNSDLSLMQSGLCSNTEDMFWWGNAAVCMEHKTGADVSAQGTGDS